MSATSNQDVCGNQCPCMPLCPLSSVVEMLGGKWKLRILCSLYQDGATRYNGLKRKIPGITNTMLAGSLRELEEDGLVLRTQYAEMPVRVEYAATEACAALAPLLGQLAQWAMRTRGQRAEAAAQCLHTKEP